jgi:radical SAM superfamily enzyme YgiQ (UPF0313 family)
MPSVLVGRGCPNRCSYCSNHKLGKIAAGKYVRFRSPANIVKEITGILADIYGITTIYLEVETLSVNLGYAYEICSALEEFNSHRVFPIEFRVNLSPHANIIRNAELISALRRANIRMVNIGLESGSEWIRQSVLRRPGYTNKELVSFCALLKKFGIMNSLYIILGLPTETPDDFHETLKCVEECQPDAVQYGFFYPYPGTDLYDKVPHDPVFNPDFERKRPYLNEPGFTKLQQIIEYILLPYKLNMGTSVVVQNLVEQSDILTAFFMKIRNWWR